MIRQLTTDIIMSCYLLATINPQKHACINKPRLEKILKAVSIWKAENGKNYKQIKEKYENIKKYGKKGKIMIYKAEKR